MAVLTQIEQKILKELSEMSKWDFKPAIRSINKGRVPRPYL